MGNRISPGAQLEAREVGDGNLNQVFVIENLTDRAQSVVVKQALPYLRVAGESWPLPANACALRARR